MFEQTLLTHPASARKTGALAASFLAQTAVLGVLLVGPLLYTQALPFIPLITGVLTAPPPLPQPPPVARVAPSGPATGQRSDYRRFVSITIPKGPIRETEVVVGPIDTAADVPVVLGIPGASVGPTTTLPAFTLAPVVEIVKPAPAPVVNTKPVLVGGDVLAAKLLKRVIPPYPVLARQTHVQGTVHLLGIVAKDGRVQNLRVLDGHPLLWKAALDAVSQWIYSPTILNGQPVEVEAPIDVNFTLR